MGSRGRHSGVQGGAAKPRVAERPVLMLTVVQMGGGSARGAWGGKRKGCWCPVGEGEARRIRGRALGGDRSGTSGKRSWHVKLREETVRGEQKTGSWTPPFGLHPISAHEKF